MIPEGTELLTQDEVDRLVKDGTRISVLWPTNRAAQEYTLVHLGRNGHAYALTDAEVRAKRLIHEYRLDNVGADEQQQRIWRKE